MSFVLSSLFALAVGAALAAGVEPTPIRPLYRRHIEQVLVTVGLAFRARRARARDLGPDRATVRGAVVLFDTTEVFGAQIPNDRFVEIAAAVVVLLGLFAFLRFTRYG